MRAGGGSSGGSNAARGQVCVLGLLLPLNTG